MTYISFTKKLDIYPKNLFLALSAFVLKAFFEELKLPDFLKNVSLKFNYCSLN